jgi:hypothetical protein
MLREVWVQILYTTKNHDIIPKYEPRSTESKQEIVILSADRTAT